MKFFKMLFLLFPLLMISSVSIAQTQCGPRDNIVQMLEQRAGQKLRGVGFVNPERVVEVFVNKETETWTIIGSTLTSSGNASSCILFYGKTWLTFEELVGDPASF